MQSELIQVLVLENLLKEFFRISEIPEGDIRSHISRFMYEDLRMSDLPYLTDEDLKNLHIRKIGHRKRILRNAKRLLENVSTLDSSSSGS